MRDTRQAPVEAATEAFAEDGVFAAWLVEATRRAGHRNRGAVHDHFGSREARLVAVLDQHADFLAAREGELLARARNTPDHDLGSVLEAIVRPSVELAETGRSGRDDPRAPVRRPRPAPHGAVRAQPPGDLLAMASGMLTAPPVARQEHRDRPQRRGYEVHVVLGAVPEAR